MITVHLLDTAIMPVEGYYSIRNYEIDFWIDQLQYAWNSSIPLRYPFAHHIVDEINLTFIELLTDLPLDDSYIKKTEFAEGDIFYIFQLKEATTRPEGKRYKPDIKDFEFLIGRYAYSLDNLFPYGNNPRTAYQRIVDY